MFDNLPATEKQAFFSILDEYFAARPHLLSGSNGSGASSNNTAAGPSPVAALTAAASAVSAHNRNNPPPAPSARKPGTSSASTPGLSSGKSIGSISTQSAGKAFGSMFAANNRSQHPVTPGQAIAGIHSATSRLNQAAGSDAERRLPPTAPSSSAATNSPDQAEVLYDYQGSDADDLNVRARDVITLLEKINEDWWRAEATDGSGRKGMVPSTYVKVL